MPCPSSSHRYADFRQDLGRKDITLEVEHQQNSIRLARLAPDEPDATSVPYYVWRHIDARDAIKISQPTNRF
jgi:hypothetical protein